MELFNPLVLILLICFIIGFVTFYSYTKKILKQIKLQVFENQSIIKYANCGIMHIDNKGSIKQINPIFLSYLGDKKEFHTQNDYFTLLDIEQLKILKTNLAEKKDCHFGQSFYNSNQQEIHLNIYLSFLPELKDVTIIATSRDEKIALQKALKRSQAFFNHSDLAHLIIDSQQKITEVNDSLCNLLDYRSEDLISKSFSLLFPTSLMYQEFIENYLQDNSVDTISGIEYRLKKSNGQIICVEMFGKKFNEGDKTYFIWSLRDITARTNSRNTIKKLNETLKKEFSKLEELIDIIPIPIFIKDKDFNYVKCNKAFCEFLKLKKEEIINKKVFDIFTEKEAIFFNKQDEKMKSQTYLFNEKIINDNLIIESHKKTLLNNEIFDGVVGIIIDITQARKDKSKLEKRVEEELVINKIAQEKHYQEQIRNAKFSSIGKMAAGITHEINTPLTYIKGNFEMLQEDMKNIADESLKNTMLYDSKTIEEGINRIGSIIESMREISQKNTEKYEYVNIYQTLIATLVLSHNRAKQIVPIKINNIYFHIKMKKDQFEYYAYIQKHRIEQVWIIIINNALDELIKIPDFEKREFNINISSDEKNIYINFLDNAGGINDEIMPKIFEPFESTKESSGIGIGLNIAKQIIEEHDGNISAQNKNAGALFEIILPIKKEL